MSANLHVPAEAAGLDQPYDPVSRAFHWLVVALVATQITIALVLPAALPASAEDTIAAWHFAVGSTVLLVMLLRLAWRLTHPMPPAPTDLPPGCVFWPRCPVRSDPRCEVEQPPLAVVGASNGALPHRAATWCSEVSGV